MASSRTPLPALNPRDPGSKANAAELAMMKALARWNTVNPRQMALLLAVSKLGTPTCTEAAAEAGLCTASLTMVKHALRQRGWLTEERPAPVAIARGDRRKVRLRLTREGEGAVRRFCEAVPLGGTSNIQR